MDTNEVDNIINSSRVYTIERAVSNFSFTTPIVNNNILKNVTIKWANEIVLETWSGSFISPAEVLSHECDHAYRAETDIEGLLKDLATGVDRYGNLEEFRVIRGSERNVAEKLGKLGGLRYGRFSHDCKNFYRAVGVRGDYLKNEIECIYKIPQ